MRANEIRRSKGTEAMAIGPVQLIVVGFKHPNFC